MTHARAIRRLALSRWTIVVALIVVTQRASITSYSNGVPMKIASFPLPVNSTVEEATGGTDGRFSALSLAVDPLFRDSNTLFSHDGNSYYVFSIEEVSTIGHA